MKKIPLDILERKAQEISRKTLADYIFTDEIFSQLTSGVIIDGDDRVFVFYIPKESAKESIDILRIRMNIYTGEGIVEYIGLKKKNESEDK